MNEMPDKVFTYVLDLTVPASIVILLILVLRLVLPVGAAMPVKGLEVPAFTSRYTLSDETGVEHTAVSVSDTVSIIFAEI